MPNLPPVYPHLTSDQIVHRITTAESDWLKKRWLVIALMSGLHDTPQEQRILRRQPGTSVRLSARRVADATGYSSQWVRKLVHAYNKDGPGAVEKKPKKRPNAGWEGALSKDQKRVLATFFEEYADSCSLVDIYTFVLNNFGIDISASTACRYKKRFKEGRFPKPLKPKKDKATPAQPTPKSTNKRSQSEHNLPKQESEAEKKKPSPQLGLWSFQTDDTT